MTWVRRRFQRRQPDCQLCLRQANGYWLGFVHLPDSCAAKRRAGVS